MFTKMERHPQNEQIPFCTLNTTGVCRCLCYEFIIMIEVCFFLSLHPFALMHSPQTKSLPVTSHPIYMVNFAFIIKVFTSDESFFCDKFFPIFAKAKDLRFPDD